MPLLILQSWLHKQWHVLIEQRAGLKLHGLISELLNRCLSLRRGLGLLHIEHQLHQIVAHDSLQE